MSAKKETFGNIIRKLRKAQGKTLQQVADVIGVSIAYYSEVELGKRPPFRADKITTLARALEASADELFNVAWQARRVIAFDTEQMSPQQNDILQSFARGGISEEKYNAIQDLLKDS